MVTIKIGSSEQSLDNLDEGWLLQQINRRRDEDEPVCVIVKVDEPSVKLTVPIGHCGGGGGSSRPLTAQEQKVIDLWKKHHLDEADFKEGELMAFLKQLRKFRD